MSYRQRVVHVHVHYLYSMKRALAYVTTMYVRAYLSCWLIEWVWFLRDG